MTRQLASSGLVALFFCGSLAVAGPQVTPPASGSPFRISVSLNLVVLPVTVRNKKGGFASDLTQQDFDVYEDGVPQSIRLFRHGDIPVTVGLVIDHSGSMQPKLQGVLEAAHRFVQASNPDDQMFVVNFNERVTLGLPPGLPFTDNADELETAVLKAPIAGETALYDAVDVGLERLKSGDREKKVLIIISDGGDNASVLALSQVLRKAVTSDAIVYTVGIFDQNDSDQNPGVLRRLSRETGGESFFPERFDDIPAICDGIARDIRNQYTIGYVSTNTQAGGHRGIHVVAHERGKNLIVRTRSGYIAASESPQTAVAVDATAAKNGKQN